MSIIQEFKSFALKGNVLDLAVGVIIGGAFGKIVNSLVADVIMPLSIAQLVDIYKCATTADQWSEVGGTSTAAIIPLIPQVGSGTGDTRASVVRPRSRSAKVPTS